MCKLSKLVSEQFTFKLSDRVLQFFVMANSQSSFSGAEKHALACIGSNVLEGVYNGSDFFSHAHEI